MHSVPFGPDHQGNRSEFMRSLFTLAVIVQRLNLDEAFSCSIDLIK